MAIRYSWLAAIIGLSVACGCGGSGKTQGGVAGNKTSGGGRAKLTTNGDGVTGDDLKQLAVAYHRFQKSNPRQAPPGWKELLEFASSGGEDTAALKRVRDGGYTVYWNVLVRDVKMGLANFVLAYCARDVANGGLVLMYDGSPKTVSSAQLKSLLARQDPTKAVGALDPVPDGGRMVKLGDGRLSLIVIDDKKSDIIVAYVIDGAGRRRVAIDAKQITAQMGNRTIRFAQYRDSNDPAAKCTRYGASLARDLETFRKGGLARFEIVINGQKLQGSASF